MLEQIIQKIDNKYNVDSVRFNFSILQEKYYIIVFNKILNNHIDTANIFISDSEKELIERFNTIYIHGFEYDCKEWRGTQCEISVNKDNQIADYTIQKDDKEKFMDNKCKYCKHADIADNICCITNVKLYYNGTEIVKNCSFFETNDVLISFPSDEYDNFLNSLNVFIKNYIKQNKECNVVMNVGFDKRVELFWKKDKKE